MTHKPFREFHVKDCPCSICRPLANAGAGSFGFLAPIDKSWNSWRWCFFVGGEGIRYLRWSGFWKRQPKRKVAAEARPE